MNLKQMAAQIGLPTKTSPTADVRLSEREYYWSKWGGYQGGNTLLKVERKAKEAGFTFSAHDPFGSPDGNVVGGNRIWRHPDGWALWMRSSYGATMADNSYTIILKHVQPTITEAIKK